MSGRIWLLVRNLSQFFSERTWTEKSWCFWCSPSWAHRPMFIGNICASRPAQIVVMLCSHGISPSSWKQGVSKFLVLVPELQKQRHYKPPLAECQFWLWLQNMFFSPSHCGSQSYSHDFPCIQDSSSRIISPASPFLILPSCSILFHPPAARPQLACACHWACCAAAVGSASHCPLGHVSLPGGNLVPIPQNLVIS